MKFYNNSSHLRSQLADCGIQDASSAVENIERIRKKLGDEAFFRLLPLILRALSKTADPDMALNNLERFAGSLQDDGEFIALCESRHEFLLSLMTVFGASRFLSSFLASFPDDGIRLLSGHEFLNIHSDGDRLRGRLRGLLSAPEKYGDYYKNLRRFRRQEMLRIGLRDLLGKAELQETVADLSDLAEVCLQAAYERAAEGLRKKHGMPMFEGADGGAEPAGFAVIAMGKLGGRELNFSSDIDLMYVYSSDGETEGVQSDDGSVTNRISNHQYFVKLAEKITSIIGETTEDGFVFRVDLRLRPEGQRGPLAQSLGGYEIYYESWGQTWERAALLKARIVAGDEETGKKFMERIAPFVHRKYLDYGAISEIRAMKQKINKDVEQKGKTWRDVKLGYGGIREIEFIIQALHLIYAGRDRALREKNSLKALHNLSQKGLITYEEHSALSRAYVFLRTVEHRMQILNDLQTQTLPTDPGELRSLARRAGYFERDREADVLLFDYAVHTRSVRAIYDDLFSFTGEEPAGGRGTGDYSLLLDADTTESDAVSVLSRMGFKDPAKAYRNVVLLREGPAFVHQTPRSRRLFQDIFPLLSGEIASSPDPDLALNHLESYLAAQGSWDAFQTRVKQDPLAVKTLIAIFANSGYFSRMLIVNPGLLEDLLDTSRSFGAGSLGFFSRQLRDAISRAEGIQERLDILRRFKHREEMRMGMAELLSAVSPIAASRTLSRLAEACLAAALELAVSEVGKRLGFDASSGGMAVIAAGKLGGRELIYGSDLDILFVFSEDHSGTSLSEITPFEYFSKTAEKTISYLTTMTREGFAYRVDTRLRPTGSKGPLVQSLAAFRQYYKTSAETWERQALIHSRFAAGDRRVGDLFKNTLQELIYRDCDVNALAKDVRDMRKRMEDELGKEGAEYYNVKQGAGGLVDIEFIAQFLQLAHGGKHPRIRVPGTYNALRALRRHWLLGPEEYAALAKAQRFLRLLESRMRIVTNTATNNLSRDAGKLQSLARRMGYQDDAIPAGRKLLNDYERTSREVRVVFDRLVHG